MRRAALLLIVAWSILLPAHPQTTFEVSNEIVPSSTYEYSSSGKELGSGWMDRLTAKVSTPIHFAECDSNPRIIWRATFVGTYTYMGNSGGAELYNPDELWSLHASIVNIRPLKGRWSLMSVVDLGMAGIGEGFNARDITVNAGAIFAYSRSRAMSYGVGVFCTTRYGMPIVLPIPFFRYTSTSRWSFDIGMMGRIEAVAKRKYNEHFTLAFDLCSIESTAANIYYENKWRVYSESTLKSAVCPEISFGAWGTVTIEAGIAWRRSTTISDRSWRGFFKNFNRHNRCVFQRAADLELIYKLPL